MKKVEKVKEEKPIETSVEDRRGIIQEQLEKAIIEREKLMSLIYKCQGALELLDSMKGEKDSD